MKKTNEMVQRISEKYVSDDCIQVMIPYYNALTILYEDGMLYHYKPNSNVYRNEYVNDDRKKQFPYHNISTHCTRSGSKIITHVNQLYEFNKPYILIGDNSIKEDYVVKDRNNVFLITHLIESESKAVKHMSYEEILKFLDKSEDGEEVYYLYRDGSIIIDKLFANADEDRLHYSLKERALKAIDFLKEQSRSYSYLGDFLKQNPWILDYTSKNLDKIDFSSIDFNIPIYGPVIVVRINDGNIKIQELDFMYVRDGDYSVTIGDIPVTKYNLEQLKLATKIYDAKEPKILLRLNPAISKYDLLEAKQFTRTLKRSDTNNL